MRRDFVISNGRLGTLFLLLAMTACSSDEMEEVAEEEMNEQIVFNYTSEAKYNLNIIYFIPTDQKDHKDSHKRLSEIFLHGQNFYKENMRANGFGDKTFNMQVDEAHQRVKITYLNAKNPTSNYPYNGGGATAQTEIEEYFAANPGESESDHFIVIIPVSNQDNAQVVPFYGLGKWCFALDFPDMDIQYFGESSKKGTDASKWIGGLMHELGHGLNLPHNKERSSDLGNVNKGTALMGAGNTTYGSSPTFITEASCAILNNNQVFNTSTDVFYTGASVEIKTFKAFFENGEIKASGTFQTEAKVNYIGFYNDASDDGTGANTNYDAVTWAVPVTGNEFSISMPISELFKRGDVPYILRLLFNHENGERTTKTFSYEFSNGVPIIDININNEDRVNLEVGNWSIVSFSSQEESNSSLANNVIDDDPSTFWHSRWTVDATEYPHELVVDMNEELVINGFSFLQRDGSRKIKDVEIQTSIDNMAWQSQGDYVLQEINTYQHIELVEPNTFRYFKVIAKSAFDGLQFAALAEVKCF